MSTLFNQMMGTSPIVQQFNEFRNNFRGNPKAELERLISTGQISQAELNAAQAKAQQLAQMLGVARR